MKKNIKLLIYIFFLLVSFILFGGVSVLTRNVNVENLSNVLTTDDVDALLRQNSNNSGSASLYSKDYFNIKKDDNLVASAKDIDVTVDGDLVTLNYYYAADFYINTISSYNSSVSITKYNGVHNGNNGYVSLKNGTYFFYTYNLNEYALKNSPAVQVSKSCNNETRNNQTGTFTVERCYIKDSNNKVDSDIKGTIGSCAAGYSMGETTVVSNGCDATQMKYGLSRRYCKVVIQATCTKNGSNPGNNNPGNNNPGNNNPGNNNPGNNNPGNTVANPKLDSIYFTPSIAISPAFKSGTYTYSASVSAATGAIHISGDTAAGSEFVSGEGPREVKLNYGVNPVRLKVKNSAGKTVTYTVNVTRQDNRSSVNTLSSLSVNDATLDPPFLSTETEYNVKVPSDTENITIDAMLTDNKSSFVPGSGPGTYELQDGINKFYIKVVSESGLTNIYTLVVERDSVPSECTTNAEEYALLKEIRLSVDINGVEVDQIEDFDPKRFNYSDIRVDYRVTNLTVNAYPKDDDDQYNIEIEGADDLEVEEPRLITIKVTSAHCPTLKNEYTLQVTRSQEKIKSSNAELENIEIEGYEIKFAKEVPAYGIKLKKGDTKLSIKLTKTDKNTKCSIDGNSDLKMGSQIDIRCVAEDGESTADYSISIDGIEKGTNIFLIIIVVIGIVIFLVYLLLKLLGYKVVFNLGVVGAFFRGLGEKFNNMFDK